MASYDINLFTDSDCFYPINFVKKMIIEVKNLNNTVVYGSTYPHMPTEGKGALTALTWLFPINSKVAKLQTNRWGNNFACRKKILSSTPFPTISHPIFENFEPKIERVLWERILEGLNISSTEIETGVTHLQIDNLREWSHRNFVHGIADVFGQKFGGAPKARILKLFLNLKWRYRRRQLFSFHKKEIGKVTLVKIVLWSLAGDFFYTLGVLYTLIKIGEVSFDLNSFKQLDLSNFNKQAIKI